MELKVTGHWNMGYNRPDSKTAYNIELKNRGPQWITKEHVERLKDSPRFKRLLEKNGYECSPAKKPYLMENPLIAVTDKNKRIVFSVDYYGSTITHHRDYRDEADQITRMLIGRSLIKANERYITKSLNMSGLTLPKYFD